MSISNILLIAVCIFAMNMSGCDFTGVHDITNDPKSSDFLDIRKVWKTKVPLYLKEADSELYIQIDDVIVNNQVHIIQVLPIGTEIRVEHLYEDSRPMPDTIIYFVMGKLLSGPYSRRELNLDSRMFAYNDLLHQHGIQSTRPTRSKVWAVDDSILEK